MWISGRDTVEGSIQFGDKEEEHRAGVRAMLTPALTAEWGESLTSLALWFLLPDKDQVQCSENIL